MCIYAREQESKNRMQQQEQEREREAEKENLGANTRTYTQISSSFDVDDNVVCETVANVKSEYVYIMKLCAIGIDIRRKTIW